MLWELYVLLLNMVWVGGVVRMWVSICAIEGGAGQTVEVIVVKVGSLILISHATSTGSSGQVAAAILAIQGSLVSIDGGEVIASVDGTGRVGDEMVAQLRKGALHSSQMSRYCYRFFTGRAGQEMESGSLQHELQRRLVQDQGR